MITFLKVLFVIVSIPLSVGCVAALWPSVRLFSQFALRHWLFAGGAAAAIVLYPFMRMSKFFRTFEHEVTHMLTAKLFLAKMESLRVQASGGGEVRYSRASNFVISLSPYFLPLYAIVVMALIPILNPKIAVYFLAPAGFLLAHHLLASVEEELAGQPDIQESGRLFSAAVIVLFGTIVYGSMISYAAGGSPETLAFLKRSPASAYELTVKYVPMAFHAAAGFFRGLGKTSA